MGSSGLGSEGRKSYTAAMGGPTSTGWRLAGAALAWLAGVALQLQQRTLWPRRVRWR